MNNKSDWLTGCCYIHCLNQNLVIWAYYNVGTLFTRESRLLSFHQPTNNFAVLNGFCFNLVLQHNTLIICFNPIFFYRCLHLKYTWNEKSLWYYLFSKQLSQFLVVKNVLTDESVETESWPYKYSTMAAVNNTPSSDTNYRRQPLLSYQYK